MTNRTITARDSTFAGEIAGIQFTAGTATADDATVAGGSAIGFAVRQGWGVSGGIATAVDLTPAQGEAISRWTVAELKAYLDGRGIQYPSGTNQAGLVAAVLDGFDMKAQGGSMVNQSAGHTSRTVGPERTPPVPVPGDDETTAGKWKTPLETNVTNDVAPTISVQPADQSVTHPATATFSVTAAGTPTPSKQWQRQAAGAGAWVDIAGATGASYTTAATTVSGGTANNTDKYRVVLDNTDGQLISNSATLTVA